MRQVSTRSVLVVGLVAALLVAGLATFYASGSPDGLEFVADQSGFAETADDGGDPLLSGVLAGVLGTLIVLVLAGSLAWAVRRRGPAQRQD